MNIEKLSLIGVRVRLEPLAETHIPALASAVSDGCLWELPVTTVPHPRDLVSFVQNAHHKLLAQEELAFATIDRSTNTVIGSTRFRSIKREHRCLEIGFTFLARSWQRTHVNTEAKYLMLCHAFEQWNANRVEFVTDVLNTASRRAITRLGATQEGILRSHMVMPRDGRVRDSVLYSITRTEWPQVKQHLHDLLVSWVKIDAPFSLAKAHQR